ncbi:glycoside hydrolase family 3 protein [Sphingomonas suaedae]|uniref:Glycoside hydrolase family 3 protein n=1 Tax=Sphingomonas suaedae TaxID=2599297 RepID=A0A518RGR4_9SPHN|nr:glycoside hydrolase family 3 protein [Sphingomonas suaedae]QDX26621.1 glycoside hydrolase family 3 protein [Sphingomonas suaedae]
MKKLLVLALGAALAAPVAAQESKVNPEIWPSPTWPQQTDNAVEARIKALIAKMSVEEKVGQVVQADISAVTPEDVRTYHLGSVLNGGSSGPYGDDFALAPKWLQLADEFYEASIDKSGGRVGIPVIWGTDAVHGHSNIIGATLFPHNIGLGAMRDPDLIEKIAQATALEIRATGQEWTFAPTVTVPRDFRWGRAYEGYSSDPKLVASYVERMVRGLQGPGNGTNLLSGPYVIASTKHFLADGGTHEGRDQGDARISEAELRDVHGAPYIPAIEQGVATVMVSFSSWNGTKMTGHKGLLTDVLKDRMNFGGFLVSDWNAHGQVEGCTNASCPKAINAGLDIYMAPDSWKPLWNSLLAQVKSGEVPMARLDDAVARILRVKMRLGLFEAGKPSSRKYAGDWSLLGHADHRAIARDAVRKSLVLLKNSGSVLPVKAGAHVLVAGDAADDIGRQSGGWTLTWQGTDVTNANFPGATSIWKGLENAVTATGGSAELAPDGKFAKKPDVAIVVFGETPYAEFQGDLKTLQLRPELRKPYETMKALKAQGIPVVAVMVTGRPLFMNPELNVADAFVVAWLPGSEGAGIADLLVQRRDRRAPYDFVGKLPAAWPATARADGPVLFPFGHGLTLAGGAMPWKPLSEESGVADEDAGNVYFANGVPSASWSLQVLGGTGDSTRITAVPADAASGRVRVTAVNHVVQEGARRFAIASGPADVALATQAPLDLTREVNGDVLLVATMRVDAKPAGSVQFRMGDAAVRATPIETAAPGEWTSYGVPLKCFAKGGANLGRVASPFTLRSEGAFTFSLARVALGNAADKVIACP